MRFRTCLSGCLLLAVTLATTFAGCAQTSPFPVGDLTTRWTTAYSSGDVDALVALYETDAIVTTSFDAPARGKEAIAALFRGDAGGGVSTSLTVDSSRAGGDLGYVSGTYAVSAGGAQVAGGRYLQVWRRDGGDWLVQGESWVEDVESIPNTIGQSWVTAYDAEDGDAIAKLYTTDARLISTDSPPVVGREAIREYWLQDFRTGGMKVRTELDVEDRWTRPNVAHLTGTFTVRPASGTTVVAQGKYSQLWVRESGGWSISREEWFRMK